MILRNVSQSYKGRTGRVRVLDQINVAFAPRTRVAIFGQIGSGKTTLLRVMCGALTPDTGWVLGNRSVSFPIGSSIRLHKATVQQHIRFVAGIYGRDVEAFSRFVSNFAGLQDVLDFPIRALGADMRGRLNFTLGFALPFKYYLFDGAMVLGDPVFRARALKALEGRREAAGYILATRFPRLARGYFRSGAVLYRGKLHLFEDLERAISYYESLPPVDALAAFHENEGDSADQKSDED